MQADIGKIIGQRIKNYRKGQRLTQEELAEKSGLHSTYIGKVERNEKGITIETLIKITDALGITVEELFRYLQPYKERHDEDIIYQIVNKLQSKNVKQQKKILSLIDIVLD
jgi:transcriptional regulator with XRE-family HTH domain